MKERKFDTFFVVCTVLFTLLMVLHRRYSYRLIFLNPFVPFLIYLSGSVFGLFALYFVRKFSFGFKESPRVYLSSITGMIKHVFLSVLVFGSAFSWGFDYVNNMVARDSDFIVQKCKVCNVSISGSGTLNSIDFDFLGENRSINNFTSTATMREAYRNRRFEDYRLDVSVRKGPWTSYVIYDFAFFKK